MFGSLYYAEQNTNLSCPFNLSLFLSWILPLTLFVRSQWDMTFDTMATCKVTVGHDLQHNIVGHDLWHNGYLYSHSGAWPLIQQFVESHHSKHVNISLQTLLHILCFWHITEYLIVLLLHQCYAKVVILFWSIHADISQKQSKYFSRTAQLLLHITAVTTSRVVRILNIGPSLYPSTIRYNLHTIIIIKFQPFNENVNHF